MWNDTFGGLWLGDYDWETTSYISIAILGQEPIARAGDRNPNQHKLPGDSLIMQTPQSFTTKTVQVIEGGYLKYPLIIPTITVNGIKFFPLHPGTDRGLAKALGANGSKRSPLKECDVFAFLAFRRDDIVDKLIKSKRSAADPMADDVPDDERRNLHSRGRANQFAEAGVDAVVEVTLEAFVTPDGERIPEHSMKMITTPVRGTIASIEAIPENFEWLMAATQVSWQDRCRKNLMKRARKEWHVELDELPELPEPVRYQKDPQKDKLSMYIRYRTDDGRWVKKQRRIAKVFDDPEMMRKLVSDGAEELAHIYISNHVEKDYDTPEVMETHANGDSQCSSLIDE